MLFSKKILYPLALCTFFLNAEVQKTLALIKPDAVEYRNTGSIIWLIEKNGFSIKEMKKIHLSKKQAEAFYAEHKGKPFFKELVDYMTSGPLVALALSKENAINDWRELMGKTDPAQAAMGTMRKQFGKDKTHNATHGSDSPASAQRELSLFFETW